LFEPDVVHAEGTTSEFAGIAAALELFGISKWLSVPFFGVLVWVLLYKGSFKRAERFFMTISLFLLVYIVSACRCCHLQR
jgi:Mn2+/Fe2+ NRAMP family transporter